MNSLFAYLPCPQLCTAPMLQLGEKRSTLLDVKNLFSTLYVLPLAVDNAKNSGSWQLENSINLILQVLFLQEQVFTDEECPFHVF